MLTFSRTKVINYLLAILFGFVAGCMLSNNLININKTCRIENTDREFNIVNNSKVKPLEFLVIILSAPSNRVQRLAIRETWLKYTTEKKAVEFKHYFVIGSATLPKQTSQALVIEQSSFHDILLLPIKDSYQNLSLKVLESFHWIHEQIVYQSLDFKYVLKVDDDSFVRLDMLAGEVTNIHNHSAKGDIVQTYPKLTASNRHMALYWGYFHGNARIQNNGKWTERNWVLCDKYLPYALGGGYMLSKEIVLFIGRNAGNLGTYNAEDVSVGVWLAPLKNIIRVHDIRFDTQWTSRGCKNHHIITHPVDIKNMYKLDQQLKKGRLCLREESRRPSYKYKWDNLPSHCCAAT